MTICQPQRSKDSRRHWVITDSGLGGLAVCAEIERSFRRSDSCHDLRITYFNAWPEQGRGYNDLPDPPSRARVFNRALVCMDQFKPDRILIACNTLSILYPMTQFSRTTAVPVLGIIDAGVDLFLEALEAYPSSSIVLFGTRITIESGVHRDRLLQKGIPKNRIAAVSCHGLAAAIEKDPAGAMVAGLLEQCAAEACRADLSGEPLCVGLCCTHYSYIKGQFRSVLERQTGKRVQILDPNDRMARCLAPEKGQETVETGLNSIVVEVISQVELDESQRRAVAKLVAPVSAVTAQALLSYTWRPGLF
jgi:glutamate racemase